MSSINKGKIEPDLHDLKLMTFAPNFELGSASEETHNKKGKSKHSKKYDCSVIFISECKY